MTPTTDTVQGWLILSMLAVAAVGMAFVVGAGVLALWDAVLARRAARIAFEREMREQRDCVLGFSQVVDVDGVPVRIQSDRALDDSDREAVDLVVRLIRFREQLDTPPAWLAQS